MAREVLVELMLAAAARPHRHCINQSNIRLLRQQCQRRYASTETKPNTNTNTSSKLPSPSSSPSNKPGIPKPGQPASKIPLHVGLDRNPENVSAISRIPIPKGIRGEQFTPSVLARPLGLQNPPRPGENTPLDKRTWSERKKDFQDYDINMAKRQIYLRTFLRPYFQEWRRVDYHKGKSFVSSDRLFRRDKALYFPNIWGSTLSKDGDGPDRGRDTTNVLRGKVTIVGVQSGHWAEEQVDTFIGAKANPELEGIIDASNGMVQRVDINIQGDWIRELLVKIFKGRLRGMVPQERWEKYFIVKLPRDVRKGLTDDIRDAMGLLNSQVGYVYLLDTDCRIRWAGSGHAWDGEVKNLNGGLKRLLEEAAATSKIASR